MWCLHAYSYLLAHYKLALETISSNNNYVTEFDDTQLRHTELHSEIWQF